MTSNSIPLDRIEISPKTGAEALCDTARLMAGDYVRLTLASLSETTPKKRVIIGAIEKVKVGANGYIEVIIYEENGKGQFPEENQEYPTTKLLIYRKRSTLIIEILSKVLRPDEPIPF